jgi:ATP-dependent helicase HrpA
VLQSLPVYHHREKIITALREHQVVVVAAETGSGKSVSLPFICREAGYGERGLIAVTQPRRIAAVSLAQYGAALSGTAPGALIGYRVRYRHAVGPATRIVYMTDGVLLASLATDPQLQRCEVIILDEAHERSVTIDFLLGHLRTLLHRRPALRLIIASATPDIRLFSRMFSGAPVITVPGRRHEVTVAYQPVISLWKGYSIDSFVEGAIRATGELCLAHATGDVLVFMPTVDDVIETTLRLRRRLERTPVTVLPLHGRLSLGQQRAVFAKGSGRKIVVATNIAETSLTVPGIRFVVDTGLARMLQYDPGAGITRMPVERISRASADQRSGRCGREADGICVRLYSETDYLSRPRFTPPEIRRAGLAGLLLKMESLHSGNPYRFPFPQRPAPAAVAEGYHLLQDIGALDRHKHLTKTGREMARFPLDPPVARMLTEAKKRGVVAEVMVIAAALSAQEPLCGPDGDTRHLPAEFVVQGSDFCTWLKVWNRLRSISGTGGLFPWKRLRGFCEQYGFQPLRLREWTDAFGHLRRICNDLPGFPEMPPGLPQVAFERVDAIHKCLLAGLVHGVAVRTGSGWYEGIGTAEIRIAPSSVTARKQFPWLLFHEIVATGRAYGTRAAAIKPQWIEELFARQCTYRYEDPWYDPDAGHVMIREEVRFRTLLLIKNRRVDCAAVDRSRAVEVFVREALAEGRIGDGYRFIRSNREILERIAVAERKVRKPLYRGDDALTQWYADRVEAASREEFTALLRVRGGDAFLLLSEENLLLEPLPDDFNAYADTVTVALYRLPVKWVHAEGDPADGAAVTVPERLVKVLPSYYWEWVMPVLVRGRGSVLISRLTPKLVARSFDPADAFDALAALPLLPEQPYGDAVGALLERLFGLPAPDTAAVLAELPEHLWLRVGVTDGKGIVREWFRPPFTKGSSAGTDQKNVAAVLAPAAQSIPGNSADPWKTPRLLAPVPCRATGQSVPCIVYPALRYRDQGVEVALFTRVNAASTVHADAVVRLCMQRCAEEMAWAVDGLALPAAFPVPAPFTRTELHETAVRLFERYVCALPETLPVTETAFDALVAEAHSRVKEGAATVTGLLERTFAALDRCGKTMARLRNRYRAGHCQPLHRELGQALDACRDALFSDTIGIRFLLHLPEYLEVFSHRAVAAFTDTASYRSIMRDVSAAEAAVARSAEYHDYPVVQAREALREMVERYCASQFSGDAGKREKVVTAADLSRQRTLLERMREACERQGDR